MLVVLILPDERDAIAGISCVVGKVRRFIMAIKESGMCRIVDVFTGGHAVKGATGRCSHAVREHWGCEPWQIRSTGKEDNGGASSFCCSIEDRRHVDKYSDDLVEELLRAESLIVCYLIPQSA